jgi:membrane protein
MMSIRERLKNNQLVVLLVETYREFNIDNSSLLAAAVSYYLLFSLFPFALAIISIAGFVMESPSFEEQLINGLATMIPVARNLITSTLHGLVSAREATGIVAIVGLIWSALAFFNALRRSLNAAWGIKQPYSFFKGQIVNILMMIGAFIGLIIFIWASTWVRFIHETNVQNDLLRYTHSLAVSRSIFAVLSIIFAFGVILLLYKFIPSRRPRWRDIWAGALLAAVILEIVRFGFIFYIKNFSTYNLVYGPVGTVIALLAFIYIFIWVLLFTAKLSAVKLRLNSNAS